MHKYKVKTMKFQAKWYVHMQYVINTVIGGNYFRWTDIRWAKGQKLGTSFIVSQGEVNFLGGPNTGSFKDWWFELLDLQRFDFYSSQK